ncbi:MAG: isochorismatase family protein [Candidatus Cloacimonetes bacterium]|nr:isochorismatase family protein [Candidatus Cloacimonadota bacterium]
MRILIDNTIFVMVDIQQKFQPHINDIDQVIKKAAILNKATEILGLPLIVTEQNPKGLGQTIDEIYLPQQYERFEKTKFSILDDEIEAYIRTMKKDTLILYGIEAHICIMQSVIEALTKEFIPVVVEDAVSSISLRNKQIALDRIIREGGIVVSTEMLLFELIKDAIHPDFKSISKLIRHGV